MTYGKFTCRDRRKTFASKIPHPALTMRQDTLYGNFFEDKPHGEGLARYCDGSSYTGEFDAGKRHGKGTLEDASGGRAIGTWDNDRRSGEFEVKLTLEERYCGKFIFDVHCIKSFCLYPIPLHYRYYFQRV